jgi:hypothetical protein
MTPLIQQAVRLAPDPETAMWVRDCKVGDASIGVIFHDYEVL